MTNQEIIPTVINSIVTILILSIIIVIFQKVRKIGNINKELSEGKHKEYTLQLDVIIAEQNLIKMESMQAIDKAEEGLKKAKENILVIEKGYDSFKFKAEEKLRVTVEEYNEIIKEKDIIIQTKDEKILLLENRLKETQESLNEIRKALT